MKNAMEIYNRITDPIQRLYFRGFLGAPGGKDVLFYWKGDVYADIPGDVYSDPDESSAKGSYAYGGGKSGRPLFGSEGYNIRHIVPDPESDDLILANREFAFYTDPDTGDPLREWANPLTGRTTPVYPIQNEYLFYRYRVIDGKLSPVVRVKREVEMMSEAFFPVGQPEKWADSFCWKTDLFQCYRLNDPGQHGIDDPMGLKNGKYTAAEFFAIFLPQNNLDLLRIKDTEPDPDWIPDVKITWSRIGPWLPWMGMSEDLFEGRLAYHTRGELLDSWDSLPADFQKKMEDYHYPIPGLGFEGWKEAPPAYDPARKNESTWSVFHEKILAPAGLTWRQWRDTFPVS